MKLRIIGGQLRGKKLNSVPGTITRPTADRVREAIFNILSSEVIDARVLDLFAGTGCLGLEALSRGARYAAFIDSNPLPLSVIKKNILTCKFEGISHIYRCDLHQDMKRLSIVGNDFDLVFMDPPYNRGLVGPTLSRLETLGLLKKNAIVVVEHSPLEPIEENISAFVIKDQRKYGKTLVSFLLNIL